MSNLPREMSVQIHPSAIVEPEVSIGSGTKIWHFCHIMAGARIGAGCVLGQNSFVAATVVIGNGCHIQNNVSLYDGVTLADDVFVGPSCVFTNVRRPRAAISRRDQFLPTLVGCGASLGANATIMAGTRIGRWAFVGAGCVVLTDVADHSLVVGNPARAIGWVSRAGERLRFSAGVALCPMTNERYLMGTSGPTLVDG